MDIQKALFLTSEHVKATHFLGINVVLVFNEVENFFHVLRKVTQVWNESE